MQLDIESLRTFIAVLDHGGMTAAAGELNMSQSSVSWKIKRLEQRVGRPLLIRDGHTLRPSRDGRALLDDAREMVAIHDRAAARLRSSELEGRVRLGAIAEVGAARIAGILGRFKLLHPGLEIEFTSSNTSTLLPLLDAGELDVAIVQVSEAELLDDDVTLWTEDLHWATSCEADFDDGPVPLVTFGASCFYRSMSEPILADNGIDHHVAISVQTTDAAQAAIAAGLGVGVIGSQFIEGDVVEWKRGSALGPLEKVHQIARTVPGEHPDVAAALMEAIVAELHCPDCIDDLLVSGV